MVNPSNALVSLTKVRESRWNRYRVWQPLGLTTLAALTPTDWDITIFDENVHAPDYEALPAPDLVGITAFTSQANRAYDVATIFRSRGVPVIMGGIHATMCPDEAGRYVDSVVTGEAEHVWKAALADFRSGGLAARYQGTHADMGEVPIARHDLLSRDYAFGAIQTTRGCPLSCSFCSVTAFNGHRYRQKPIRNVIAEFATIRERRVLIVDDNLIGTTTKHIQRTKALFKAMIRAKLGKRWIAQATINMADDDELLKLAAQAGCVGVFIGFESPTEEGLAEIGKVFNTRNARDLPTSVRRIQRHGIVVAGSFIMGLDSDTRGIGTRIAEAAKQYGVDAVNALYLTPLPGTQLFDDMKAERRLSADCFPEEWKYYTLTFPVADYKHLAPLEIEEEMEACSKAFYAAHQVLRRLWRSLRQWRRPLVVLVTNLSYRDNAALNVAKCHAFLSRARLVRSGLRNHFAAEDKVHDRIRMKERSSSGRCGNLVLETGSDERSLFSTKRNLD